MGKETLKMGKAITDEYTNRYNKTHSVAKHLDFLNTQILPHNDKTLKYLPMTRPFVAAPDIYKVYDIKDKTIDVINSYINYYISDKAHWCRYRYTTPPDWIKEHLGEFALKPKPAKKKIKQKKNKQKERQKKQNYQLRILTHQKHIINI